MRFAPVLTDLATRLAGGPPDGAVGRAYALRDAASIVEPDVLVTHLDARLEARALARVVSDAEDLVDGLLDAQPLAGLGGCAVVVEMVRTLVGAGGRPVAATMTGPQTLAEVLASGGDEDIEEVAELCGDALAAYGGALAQAGAATVIVVEAGEAPERAHAPIVRALAQFGAEAVLWAPGADDDVDSGYSVGVVALSPDPATWGSVDPAAMDLVITSASLAEDVDLDVVRAVRSRWR